MLDLAVPVQMRLCGIFQTPSISALCLGGSRQRLAFNKAIIKIIKAEMPMTI